jgi:predicted GTPase
MLLEISPTSIRSSHYDAQFANDASGGSLDVGRDLHSCTKEVARSPVFTVDGRRVVLIDTPGFDDNEVSDVGTLKQIASFMAEA